MRIRITGYARKRMIERKITRQEVEDAIHHPASRPNPSSHGGGRVIFTGTRGAVRWR
jgi:hypothetical protein